MKNILVCGGTGFIGKNVVLNFYKKKCTKFIQLILEAGL